MPMLVSENVLLGSSLDTCRYQRSEKPARQVFRSADGRALFGIDEPTIFRNLLLLGGAGCGKTNVMNQIVSQTPFMQAGQNGRSISLIFDTKGDYCSHPGFFRPGDYLIANDRAHRDQSRIWNLFDEVLADGTDPRDYEANAREIASIFFRDRVSATQPFFAHAARDIFASTIIYFIRKSQDPARREAWASNLNNQYLKNFLLACTPQKLMEYLGSYDDFRGLSSYLGDGTSNQALGVMGELRSMLYECFQGNFAEVQKTGQPYFSIREAIRNKSDRRIFILYDMSLGETLTPIYRLLVDLALKEALSNDQGGTGSVHIFLDELKLVPQLGHLEDALNFGRSKHVSVVAGLQSVGQINAAYGPEVGHDILAGFGSIFAFHLNDEESRRYVSDLFGLNLMSYRYQNAGNGQLDREREGHTVEDWDLQMLSCGEAVVGLASQPTPFRFQFSLDPDAR